MPSDQDFVDALSSTGTTPKRTRDDDFVDAVRERVPEEASIEVVGPGPRPFNPVTHAALVGAPRAAAGMADMASRVTPVGIVREGITRAAESLGYESPLPPMNLAEPVQKVGEAAYEYVTGDPYREPHPTFNELAPDLAVQGMLLGTVGGPAGAIAAATGGATEGAIVPRGGQALGTGGGMLVDAAMTAATRGRYTGNRPGIPFPKREQAYQGIRRMGDRLELDRSVPELERRNRAAWDEITEELPRYAVDAAPVRRSAVKIARSYPLGGNDARARAAAALDTEGMLPPTVSAALEIENGVTLEDVQNIRSQLLTARRAAIRRGDDKAARNLSILAEDARTTIDSAVRDGFVPAGIATKLQQAQAYRARLADREFLSSILGDTPENFRPSTALTRLDKNWDEAVRAFGEEGATHFRGILAKMRESTARGRSARDVAYRVGSPAGGGVGAMAGYAASETLGVPGWVGAAAGSWLGAGISGPVSQWIARRVSKSALEDIAISALYDRDVYQKLVSDVSPQATRAVAMDLLGFTARHQDLADRPLEDE